MVMMQNWKAVLWTNLKTDNWKKTQMIEKLYSTNWIQYTIDLKMFDVLIFASKREHWQLWPAIALIHLNFRDEKM